MKQYQNQDKCPVCKQKINLDDATYEIIIDPIGGQMRKDEIYYKHIALLEAANDETQKYEEHLENLKRLRMWREGVQDATGMDLNGDYYYIEKGIDRPMLVGVFLDWKHKEEGE